MRTRAIPGWTTLMLCFLATTGAVAATTYHLGVDVPARLAGTDFLPGDIVRSDNAAYSLEISFGQGFPFAALGRRLDGDWLLSPGSSAFIQGVWVSPGDLLLFDGSIVAKIFDGAAAGIPAGVRLDAVLTDPHTDDPVFSFDVPTGISGVDYGPSDLVVARGGRLSLWWDARAAGVPDESNLVGAALDNDGTLLLTFDVPTDLAGTNFLPGDLIRWRGGVSFDGFFSDPSWPEGVILSDFTIAPTGSGAVPETSLDVSLAAAGEIALTWDASCASADFDYEVYEGLIGTYYSHTVKFCSTGGANAITFAPGAADSYYLVVPRNLMREGSYGLTSAGAERPPAGGACLTQQIATCH